MAKETGLTASVLAALSDRDWHSCAGVSAAVPEEHRKLANVVLCQLFARQRVERRGAHRAYEYRLLPVGDIADPAPEPEPAAEPDPQTADERTTPERTPTRPAPARLTASLGTLVGARPSPVNPAQGRIEDALAAVLDRREPRMLDQVLADVPNGWSRTDVISGLAEGVVTGWIRARRAGARDAYLLVRDPPPVRDNPQVARFKSHRLLELCRMLDADLADALSQAREYDAPPELVRSLVEMRHCAARTLRHLEA